jgi:hypothetical protein
MEMTLTQLANGGQIDHRDFLDRVDILSTLGRRCSFPTTRSFIGWPRISFRYTRHKIGIVLGVPTLREVFDEKFYTDLDGGILESFGRLFKNDLKLYVYPLQDPATGALITAGNLRVEPHLRHLYAYLLENRFIEALKDYNPACLPIFSGSALAKIQKGDASWEEMVPPEVARIIKERSLLGYHHKP